MPCLLGRTRVLTSLLGLALVLASGPARAQYRAVALDSDLSGKAKHTDGLLKNAGDWPTAPRGLSGSATRRTVGPLCTTAWGTRKVCR